MRKRIWILDLVFIFLLGYFSSISYKQISILFIGNSYTYKNDMPLIFREIAKSKGKDVHVEQCTQGRATFLIQSERKEVYKYIESRKWDYIIIQGSSRDLLQKPSILQKKSIPALKKIVKAIDRTNPNAKKLFYMTWAYKNGYRGNKETNTYFKMTQKVKEGYLKLKNIFKIDVVPVGIAWYKVREKNKDINLYVKDCSHPSLQGSYLTACCFYAGIFNEEPNGSEYYSKLDTNTCSLLQETASNTVLKQKDKFSFEN